MTQKHFKLLAANLNYIRPPDDDSADAWSMWNSCVQAVGDACREANPRFDRDRFETACGMNGE